LIYISEILKIKSVKKFALVFALLFSVFNIILATTYTVLNTDNNGAGSLRQAISSSSPTICSGETIDLIFTTTLANGPFDIVVNGVTYDNITSGSIFASFTLTNTAIYTLTQVTDNSGCMSIGASQATTVTLNNIAA